MVHEHVVAGIATALRAGALTADAVALEARKWGEADQGAEQPADQDAPRRRVDGGATVTPHPSEGGPRRSLIQGSARRSWTG
jgi:hypothetical protein